MPGNYKAIIDKIIKENKDKVDPELVILQAVQQKLGYVGKEYQQYIASKTTIPLTTLYGIVTFYPQLKLNPPGRNTIKVCQGTACHVRGGEKVLQKLEDVIGIKPDQTTADRRFSLESVRCLGCCGLSPVIMVNDETFGRVKPMNLEKIITRFK